MSEILAAVLPPIVETKQPERLAGMATKTILAATLGEALEFYDFTVYGVFAVYVAHAFFPTNSEFLSLLLTVATFGIGFLSRPLGALVLGAYAERAGRKKVLTWTIWLMGIGTGAIAILPTYDSIGIAAPIILVAARLVQGFSAGGEVGAASLLIYEVVPERRRGFSMSWQLASRSIALIVSGAVGYALTASLSHAEIQQWGWRLTFAIGLLIVPVGIYIRSSIDETLTPSHENRSMRDVMLELTKWPQTVPIVLSVLFIGGVAVNQLLFPLHDHMYALVILKLPAFYAMLAPVFSGVTGAAACVLGRLVGRQVRHDVGESRSTRPPDALRLSGFLHHQCQRQRLGFPGYHCYALGSAHDIDRGHEHGRRPSLPGVDPSRRRISHLCAGARDLRWDRPGHRHEPDRMDRRFSFDCLGLRTCQPVEHHGLCAHPTSTTARGSAQGLLMDRICLPRASPKTRSDQHLVAAHCRFDQRAATIVGRNLPGQSSMFRDHLRGQSRCVGGPISLFGAVVDHGGITTLMSVPCAAIVW